MLETRIAELLVELESPDGLTEEGQAVLDGWLAQSAGNQTFLRKVTSDESVIGDLQVFLGMDIDDLLQKVEAGIEEPISDEPISITVPARKPLIRRLMPYVAAAVVLGCLILTYLLKAPGKENLSARSSIGGHTIDAFYQKAPDGGPVRLTLGNGVAIDLDTVQNKLSVTQGTVLASVDDDRLLQYASGHKENLMPDATTPGIIYNSLQVPYGNRYKVQLSDGTKVNLNAGSSIRFPVAFTGKERIVEVSGEVFFQVADDKLHPFVVKTRRHQIDVLGTSFAVTDYPNEPNSKVVVETGKVQLHRENKAPIILDPSQQATVAENGDVSVKSGINLGDSLAWKEEYFNFDGLDIKAALWQLAQSYHMRILFDENIKSGTLGSGKIQRDLPLKRLLNDLELSDLHFDINKQENTIVVRR